MNIYLLLLVIAALIGSKIYLKDFNHEYLNIDTTSCIKGLFVLIVFYSHIASYVEFSSSNDFFMTKFILFLGQLMVTMFLFYSGYGIYESIKRKKREYIDSFPKNRILKTYVHFVLIVLTYWIVNMIVGIKYEAIDIFLSFLVWHSLGNSNWYIFIILVLYVITYISFKIFSKSDRKAIMSTWILSIIGIIILKNCRPIYWINTLLCFPLGMTYSHHKEDIDKFLFNNKKYIFTLIALSVSFCLFRLYAHENLSFYLLMSIAFSLVVVLLTMKINIRNTFLKWFGDRLFLAYILQRLPMIVLRHIVTNPYLYFGLCFVMMIFLIIIFDMILKKFDKIFFNKKRC